MKSLSPIDLYRLPWNLTDNAISWLEPTSNCNMYCDGCYRENRKESHKSLSRIKHELEIFKKYRKTDAVSVAGGEPLLHPEIFDIIKLIKKYGWKVNLNTNGMLLNREIVKELKYSGIDSFTIHIDSGQERKGWKGKNEIELNDLRLELAEMISEVGGMTLAFNSTVYPETLQFVPEMIEFAGKHIDKIHIMVFILYRMAILGKGYDFYAGSEKVFFDDMMYSKHDDNRRTDISAVELVSLIREKLPDFSPCAYLNGTEKPDTYKWLLTGRVGSKKKILGYVGPKFMEIMQSFKHLFTGKYLSYAHLPSTRRGRLLFMFSPFDSGIKKITQNYFKTFTEAPSTFFGKLHYQSVMIIQPADILKDGRINMCDGCPDITVWNDELVWSCRMEEQIRWGQNIRPVPIKSEE